MYAYAPHVCLVPKEARREHWVPWNLGYRWLWAAEWVLRIKPRSLGGCWAVSSPGPSCLKSFTNYWIQEANSSMWMPREARRGVTSGVSSGCELHTWVLGTELCWESKMDSGLSLVFFASHMCGYFINCSRYNCRYSVLARGLFQGILVLKP